MQGSLRKLLSMIILMVMRQDLCIYLVDVCRYLAAWQ